MEGENIDIVLALCCPQQKQSNNALSSNTATVVLDNNTLCEDQNQDVPINQAAPKTMDAHEQVLPVIRKRRTNKRPMERGTNIDATAVENKHPNKKLLPDSPGGKVLASMVNNKVANAPYPKKNKFVNTALWKTLEAASETEDEQEVCESQQKRRKKKSKEAASQTVDEQQVCETWEKLRTEKSKEAVSQTADEQVCEARQKKSKKKSKEAAYQTVDEQEVCEVQQKRKKKKKGREAASQIEDEHEACEAPEKGKKRNKEAAAETEDEQQVCEAATQTHHEQQVCETQQKRRRKKKKRTVSEISEFGLMKNQEEILLDNSCLAMQSRNLPDSANTPLVEANGAETYQRKDKGKDSNPSVSKKKRSKPKAKPMVVESIKRDKSLESISRFDCFSDYLQQENEGDSSKIHRTVQKSEFLVEQTQADSPTDCKQDNKSTLLETHNHVDDSCSPTLKEVFELGNQSSLKKKKSKKTSKAKLIQSTHEERDFSKVQKTRHGRDIVGEQTIGDLPTDYKGNNDLSFLKTNDHVDEIHSPILRATSEQANPSELCKEDCDTSSQDKILAVDNSSSVHPNKKKKHKKDKLKHISHVTVADETNTTTLNESQLEEIVPSTRDYKNDTVMTKDCQIGEIGPSAGSKIDAVMMETEIDNPSVRIAFVDDSSADLAKKRSASRKRRRKDKTMVGESYAAQATQTEEHHDQLPFEDQPVQEGVHRDSEPFTATFGTQQGLATDASTGAHPSGYAELDRKMHALETSNRQLHYTLNTIQNTSDTRLTAIESSITHLTSLMVSFMQQQQKEPPSQEPTLPPP